MPVRMSSCYTHPGMAMPKLIKWPEILLRREEIVHVLPSNTVEEMETNVENLTQWAKQWRPTA
jgi:hypothetical protein